MHSRSGSIQLQLRILLFLLSFATLSQAQTRYLIPFRDGDHWGYADTNLHIVIKPEYDEANIFFSGYAQVKKGQLMGLLNVRGEEALPAVYNEIHNNYGETVVIIKNGQSGLVRLKDMRIVLPVSDRSIYPLYGRFYTTAAKGQLKGIFDVRAAKWVLTEKYDEISFDPAQTHWMEDRQYYMAKRKGDTLHFFLTGDGRFSIIKPVVQRPSIIEKKKIPEGPPEEDLIDSAVAQKNFFLTQPYTQNGKQGFLSILARDGVKTIDSIPAIYDAIRQVKGSDQLLIVRKDGKEGVITVNNKEVMPCMYEAVKAVDSTPVHGIFIVKMNGRYGLAQANNLLLPCQYDTIMGRQGEIEGFELLQNKAHGAYLYDKARRLYHIVIPARYDIVWGLSALQAADFDRSIGYHFKFEHDKFLVYVTKGGKRGFVDLSGREFFRD